MGIGPRARGSAFGIDGSPSAAMCVRIAVGVLSALSILATGGSAYGQSLTGSSASLDRQNAQAAVHDYSFLESANRVYTFVEAGYLVPITPGRDFDLHDVSYPYARPEGRLFIQRLAPQYRAACGEKLVVTSLTRPLSEQPWNASPRSVHPTGMAVDLRRSNVSRCRQWLESTLLSLEAAGVLEATRETKPPHYHVVVYPRPYASYVSGIIAERPDQIEADPAPLPVMVASTETVTAAAVAAPDPAPASDARGVREHVVGRGDTLGSIAMLYGTSVARIKSDNGLSGDRIVAGQELVVQWAGPVEPPSTPIEHRVGRGESLWTIARLYGVSENELRALNGITGSTILVGQRLAVPASASDREYLQHTVEGGDSLWTIADRYGTSVAEIRRTNGIGGSRILAGQVIRVPQAD